MLLNVDAHDGVLVLVLCLTLPLLKDTHIVGEITNWAGVLVALGPTVSSITVLLCVPNLLHNIYMGHTQSHLCW